MKRLFLSIVLALSLCPAVLAVDYYGFLTESGGTAGQFTAAGFRRQKNAVITLPAGTVTELSAYVHYTTDTTQTIRLALYDSNGDIVCQGSAAVDINNSNFEWVGHTGLSVAISAGDYRIGISYNAANAFNSEYYYVDATSGNTATDATDYTSIGWPATIPVAANDSARQNSIRVGITASATTLNVPTLSTPSDTATGQLTSVDLGISDTNSSPNETGIIFRIKASGGSYSYSSQQAADTTSLSAATALGSGLANSTTYEWSAKAVGDGGSTTNDSAYPTDFSFTTEAGATPTSRMRGLLGVGR